MKYLLYELRSPTHKFKLESKILNENIIKIKCKGLHDKEDLVNYK